MRAFSMQILTLHSGECYYCQNGGSARCVKSQALGSPNLDGAQAEYVRVPFADGTVIKAPEGIHDQALILMADIFPTGYFGVKSGVEMMPKLELRDSTIVVIGCGPVGLCAIAAAAVLKPKHLFAVDSVQSRLEQAAKLGAEPLNFMESRGEMIERVKSVTDGRGADIVVEVVGLPPALRTAFDLVRSFGAISSIGVHNAEVCVMMLLWLMAILTCNRSLGQAVTLTSEFQLVVLLYKANQV
jgi:threonine dehydrogenase-like Zn-dependent dehydrogenase